MTRKCGNRIISSTALTEAWIVLLVIFKNYDIAKCTISVVSISACVVDEG